MTSAAVPDGHVPPKRPRTTPRATSLPPGTKIPPRSSKEEPGWAGWVPFAAVFMILSGGLNAFYGIVALVDDEWVVWANRSALYLDLTEWGWVHLAVGLTVAASGIGVLSGRMIARVVGVLAAGVGVVTNFFFIPAYPLWAITVMILDLFTIWALVVHGHETSHG